MTQNTKRDCHTKIVVLVTGIVIGLLFGMKIGVTLVESDLERIEQLEAEVGNLQQCLDECKWQGNYTYHKWQEQFCFNIGDTSQALEHARIAKNIGDIHVQQPDD